MTKAAICALMALCALPLAAEQPAQSPAGGTGAATHSKKRKARLAPVVPAPVVPSKEPKKASSESGLKATPAQFLPLFAQDLRPQWRQFYRKTVQRSPSDRYRAALGVGAVWADLFLAAEGRDAAHVRNLIGDLEALDRIIGIGAKASHSHKKMNDLAETGDWDGLRAEMGGLMKNERRYLEEQQDEALGKLAETGMWLRFMHISSRFCLHHKIAPTLPLEHWPALISQVEALTKPVCAADKCASLRFLKDRLISLRRIWTAEPVAESLDARLHLSDDVLQEIQERLVEDKPASPGLKSS